MNKGSVANKITGAGDDALKDEKYFEELADALLSGEPAGNAAGTAAKMDNKEE